MAKRYAVLDIDRGIKDKSKVILAEFNTLKEATEWQSKLKIYDKNPLLKFANYPIWDFKGKPSTLEGLRKQCSKIKKSK
jgi:hypothetical protein